jgi:hypothetical protein
MRWGQMIDYAMLGWYQPNAWATNPSAGHRTFPAHFNYWTPENPSNDFPVMDYTYAHGSESGFEGLSYVDGSYFKIKNITLGYTLPKKWIQKLHIGNLRVYGTITNPLILAKSPLLKGYDPEMNGSMDYPLTKSLVGGVNITF